VRDEHRRYGTRQEIWEEIRRSGLTPARSERRFQESAIACGRLEMMWPQVEYGRILYVVEGDDDPDADEWTPAPVPLDVDTPSDHREFPVVPPSGVVTGGSPTATVESPGPE
jgi:hypothetical protein